MARRKTRWWSLRTSPFTEDAHEQEGFANWRKKDRTAVLDMITSQGIPGLKVVLICGHFHFNVVVTSRYGKVPLGIIATTSVGTTMVWRPLDNVPEHRVPALRRRWPQGPSAMPSSSASRPATRRTSRISQEGLCARRAPLRRPRELGSSMRQRFFKVAEPQSASCRRL